MINDQWNWGDPLLNQLLETAAARLGELNAYSRLVPSIDLFIQMHVAKEAVVSSKIEGTKTQIDEALMNEAEIAPERRNDWQEVNNYIQALNESIELLDKIPVSCRLLKRAHKILLSSVRGANKQPGEFRRSQNWIGGASLADATFIPPHPQHVDELMSDLERFLHNTDVHLTALIKIGIAHYQLETIHPFLDGNGRIGRLLIPLYLVEQNLLDKPLLYLSAFFEKDKGMYYDKLHFAHTKNEMRQWLRYFLVGVAQTAERGSKTLSKVVHLKERLEKTIELNFGRRSPKASQLLNHLFLRPTIQVKQVKDLTQTTYKAANSLVTQFVEAGILKESTGQLRNRSFVFEEYLNLFNW